jgi:hypothetical protein
MENTFTNKQGLTVNFPPTAKLEICTRPSMLNDGWIEVSTEIFRSWGGERRIGNTPYNGPVYFYLSNEIETAIKAVEYANV